MSDISQIHVLTADEIDLVSGGDQSHYDAGKALADTLQEAAHRVAEWFRDTFK